MRACSICIRLRPPSPKSIEKSLLLDTLRIRYNLPSKSCSIRSCLANGFFRFYVLEIAVFFAENKNSFSLFTAYQILRSERKNRSYFLSAILKCRIEKQNCTLRGLRKENRQNIWLFRKGMLYYLHTNEYVHGYIVFNLLQPFLTWKRNDHMFDHLAK